MYSLLLKKGYGTTEKIRKCSDGTEYEITEIREPKAFGFFCILRSMSLRFFIHSHFVRAQTFDYVKR